MRADEEIIQRIKERENEDFFGFEIQELIARLPFEKAKPWLRDEVSPEEWRQLPRDRDSILKEMRDYMPFAWDKANNFRGISAWRTMLHYMAWTWLVGDDFGDLTNCQYYGKDNLVRVCNHYGWESKQWDDGVRANSEED